VNAPDPYPDQRPSVGVRWYRHLHRVVVLSLAAFALVAVAAALVAVATGTVTDWLTTDGDFDASAGRVLAACFVVAALLTPLVLAGAWIFRRLQERRWERLARSTRERRQCSSRV
jgi:hypothetical protein